MRKPTLGEWAGLAILAERVRREVDATLGGLVERVSRGDDSALVPAIDRLIEVGRPEQAERLQALLTTGGA